MRDLDFKGRLVYLTPHLEKWLRDLNPEFNVPLSNRLAKVIKVFDWDTEEGKALLLAREKTGKWGSLDPKDFKFVLKVYFPDLIKGDKTGVTIEEIAPKLFPDTKKAMFSLVPTWMLEDMVKEEKEAFLVFSKDSTETRKKEPSKKTTKKSAKKRTVAKASVKKPVKKNVKSTSRKKI